MLALPRRTSFWPPSMIYISVIIIHITNYNPSHINHMPERQLLYNSCIQIWINNLFFSPLFSQQSTPPHSGKLPAVTHILFFQMACKMMSHRCVIAWPVSAKKMYTTGIFRNFSRMANRGFLRRVSWQTNWNFQGKDLQKGPKTLKEPPKHIFGNPR